MSKIGFRQYAHSRHYPASTQGGRLDGNDTASRVESCSGINDINIRPEQTLLRRDTLAAFVAINMKAAEVTYTPPIPIEIEAAVYPVNSLASGTVVVIVVVEQDGQVSDAEVVKSVDSLDEPSVYAAKQWRFEPARLDGQPIRSKASISFVYDRGLFPPTKPKK